MKSAILVAIAAVALGLALGVEAKEPKACINLETGQIIYVGEGMPCPYPTADY